MKQQQQLDARISAALGSGNVAADDLQGLIPMIETGIEAAASLAAAERARSLDPSTSPDDAGHAAQRAAISELRRDRLKAALPRVEQKLAAALAADAADRWNAEANKVVGRVTAATEQLARYSEWAELIAVALAGADAANKEVERINGSAPDDVHRRIDKIDLSPFKTLVLPDPAHPNQNLWPPPQPSLAEQYAASMAPVHDPRYSADWASAREARAEAARAELERSARYHAEAGRREEERQNRDERERFVHRRA